MVRGPALAVLVQRDEIGEIGVCVVECPFPDCVQVRAVASAAQRGDEGEPLGQRTGVCGGICGGTGTSEEDRQGAGQPG